MDFTLTLRRARTARPTSHLEIISHFRFEFDWRAGESLHPITSNFFSRLLIHRQPEAGDIFIEVDEAVLRHRLAFEDVPEQFVADFDIDGREEFGHRRIQAGHHDVVVVHLARRAG